MIMPITGLDRVLKADWTAQWVNNPGMVCVSTGGRSWELKNDAALPNDVAAVGCGGWDASGRLHWVGIDLDVGHGKPESQYATRADAIDAATALREFVGGAAEVRLSKSGNGVHVRVAIGGNITDGRNKARLIAWWLAKQLGLKCDHAVLGRQNLWFWARETAEFSFSCVIKCSGTWKPPDEALSPEKPQPVIRQTTASMVQERAWKYIAKIPGAVSGSGGHNATFHAACSLVIGFGLSIDDARPLLRQWNMTCQPPWSERELEHKLRQAEKAEGVRGHLLGSDKPMKYTMPKSEPKAAPAASTDTPAAALFGQLRDEISGKRFAAAWPWRIVSRLTLALLPQTVTLFGGSKGATKSFMLVQAAQFWMKEGYKPAVLMLEEDRTFHLRRALAQLVGNGDVTDPAWVKNNQSVVDAYEREHSDYLNQFGACIHDTLEGISTNGILEWIESVAAKGSRVIVVDPITVRDADDRHVWIDDKKLINVSKRITRKYNTSLILAAHPPKTNANTAKKQDDAWGDEAIGGGVILQNLAQNIVSLVNMRNQDFVSCKDWTGLIADVEINRKLQLRKTRSGKGQGFEIGFWFDPKTLQFEERGVIGQ